MKDSVPNTDEIEPTEDHAEDSATEGAAGAAQPGGKGERAFDDDLGDLDEFDELEEGEQLDTELLALREEFGDLNDRHLRLAAEFNNYRRRIEAERLELWSRAQAEVVGKFADVLDDLQRVAGLDLSNATVEAIMEGIDLVDRKFVRMLGDVGVEILDPAGERFDPERMEAMMRVPAESEETTTRWRRCSRRGMRSKAFSSGLPG